MWTPDKRGVPGRLLHSAAWVVVSRAGVVRRSATEQSWRVAAGARPLVVAAGGRGGGLDAEVAGKAVNGLTGG